jgi:hypothetical protein
MNRVEEDAASGMMRDAQFHGIDAVRPVAVPCIPVQATLSDTSANRGRIVV